MMRNWQLRPAPAGTQAGSCGAEEPSAKPMRAATARAGLPQGMRRTGSSRLQRRRCALLAAPILVPVSMAGAFAGLQRLLGPRHAYNAGFALYWAGWCLAFPLWLAGPRRVVRLLREGARPSAAELALLALPVAGAAATELAPNRRAIDAMLAVAMVGTAVVNATGEELLWRGTYMDAFPDNVWYGAGWPWVGFTIWHLAPQLILAPRRGRARFLAGAGLVGAASARVAWRTRGLRWVLLAHVLTDACGVRAALYRLGRINVGPPPRPPA